MAGYAG